MCGGWRERKNGSEKSDSTSGERDIRYGDGYNKRGLRNSTSGERDKTSGEWNNTSGERDNTSGERDISGVSKQTGNRENKLGEG